MAPISRSGHLDSGRFFFIHRHIGGFLIELRYEETLVRIDKTRASCMLLLFTRHLGGGNMNRTKVFISKQGDYSKDDDDLVKIMEGALTDVELVGRVVQVTISDNYKDMLPQAITDEEASVLVFVTRGMLGDALLVSSEYPNLRVVLLSELPSNPGESDLVHIQKGKGNIFPEDMPELILGDTTKE